VCPSPSMTAMGGEDDVVARSARLAPGPDVAASIPEALSRDRVYECGGVSLGPLGTTPSGIRAAMHHSRPVRQPGIRARGSQEEGRGQAGKAVRFVSLYRMRSLTAVLKRRTGAAAIDRDQL
jgi:hypothetical protein